MAKPNEEWELSKENIQPIQQGRKQKVLKVALAPHPEDLILQQKQAFEHELRAYSGDDPLSVWCKYIKWVEQNFPKGGKEGHIKQLTEHCLSVLKEESKYFDDERFIDIFLKFANISTKPMDVYNYMFAQNIGCKSAKFFINWSWELEQLGHFKKADEVLTEGMNRKAQPFEKLKSHCAEFEVRLANKIKEKSEANEIENCRSAFTMLRPVGRNVAPIVRIGEAIENRKPLILGRQPQIKNTNSAKISFKIYNSENASSSLPVQSKSIAPPVLNSEIYKENERKPSKWNKVKIKSSNQYLKSSSDVDVGFKFHCDEESENIKTVKSAHKTSNALSVRNKVHDPPIALFEPADPSKRAMYDKNKVYGGAEEYSLEEIRAAAWFEKQKKIEQDRLVVEQQKKIEQQAKDVEEMKKMIEHLTQKVQFFQSNSGNEVKSYNPRTATVNVENKMGPKEKNNIAAPHQNSINFPESFTNLLPSRKETISNCNGAEVLENDCIDSTSYLAAAKMVQDLYNRTLTRSADDTDHKQYSDIYSEFSDKSNIPSADSNRKSINHDTENCIPDEPKGSLSFTFFHDPTEIIPGATKYTSGNIPIGNDEESVQNSLPYNKIHKVTYNSENIENIPPKEYVQDTNKRELSGILVPSKNILYIPLEEQEKFMNSDSEDDYACNNKQPIDETLIPPSNTEQFKTDKFLASTPYISRASKNNDGEAGKNDVETVKSQITPSNVYKVPESDCEVKDNDIPIMKATANKPHTTSKLPKVLSVIMERSSENYSKSSSSSSSVNLTKSGNFDASVNQHGNIRKNLQKLEICEPTPLSTVPEVSDSVLDASDANIPNNSSITYSAMNDNEIYSPDFDPFDQLVNVKFLKSIKLAMYKNLYKIDKLITTFKGGESIHVGSTTYRVEKLIAEGAYAKVYEALPFVLCNSKSVPSVALKVCKHANEWEFYICHELQKRLSAKSCLPDVKNSLMSISSAVKFTNGILLVNEHCDLGTLLDVVNFHKKQNSAVPELIVMYFTLEILHIVSKLHECNIIHGDIKPDNFLLRGNAFECDVVEHLSEYLTSLRLIDFGRAIDLNFYKNGVCFTNTFSTTHFKCNEMKENKPWVFQLDWYGVLSCIHTMLFSEYMNVKKVNGNWKIEKRFPRYWFTSLWDSLFTELLNIPSCYQKPDIKKYVNMIESKLQENSKSFMQHLSRLSSSYLRKK